MVSFSGEYEVQRVKFILGFGDKGKLLYSYA